MEIFQSTPLLLDKWRTPLILSEVRTESVADWNTLPPVCFVCQPGIVGQKSCPRKIYNPPTFELYGAPPPPFQMYGTPHLSCQKSKLNKLASLEAMLVQNYDPPTHPCLARLLTLINTQMHNMTSWQYVPKVLHQEEGGSHSSPLHIWYIKWNTY